MRPGVVLVSMLFIACGRFEFTELPPAGDGGTQVAPGDAYSDVLVITEQACLSPIGGVANTLGSFGQSIASDDARVYLGMADGPQGIQVFDAEAGPGAVFRTDSGPGMIAGSSNDVLGLAVSGSQLFAATYSGGLVILDVATAMAAFVGAVDLPSESWAVAVKGQRAFVANYAAGVTIVDVSVPSTPSIVTSVALSGNVHDVSIVDSTLYAVSYNNFHVVDITNPDSPVVLPGLATGQQLYELATPGNGYAYVVDKTSRQLITIVLDSSPPTIVDVTAPDSTMDFRGIDATGEGIVVALGSGTAGAVRIYDITNPARPMLRDESQAAGRVFEVELVGSRVIGATYETGEVQTWEVEPCP